MDAWAALWFWPLTDTDGATPPTLDQWIEACQALLGREPEARKNNRRHDATGRGHQLGRPERGRGTEPRLRRGSQRRAGARGATRGSRSARRSPSSRASSTGNSTSRRCSRAAASTCSWATRHGCDRGRTWMHCSPRAIHGGSWPSNQARQPATRSGKRHWHFQESVTWSSSATADVDRHAEYLGSAQAYPLLAGLQPDLYRCFMEQTWRHASRDGRRHADSSGDRTSLTRRLRLLREHTYLRLRRHWQFINELMLYEIHDQHAVWRPRIW